MLGILSLPLRKVFEEIVIKTLSLIHSFIDLTLNRLNISRNSVIVKDVKFPITSKSNEEFNHIDTTRSVETSLIHKDGLDEISDLHSFLQTIVKLPSLLKQFKIFNSPLILHWHRRPPLSHKAPS